MANSQLLQFKLELRPPNKAVNSWLILHPEIVHELGDKLDLTTETRELAIARLAKR
jgi:hypothetical protein